VSWRRRALWLYRAFVARAVEAHFGAHDVRRRAPLNARLHGIYGRECFRGHPEVPDAVRACLEGALIAVENSNSDAARGLIRGEISVCRSAERHRKRRRSVRSMARQARLSGTMIGSRRHSRCFRSERVHGLVVDRVRAGDGKENGERAPRERPNSGRTRHGHATFGSPGLNAVLHAEGSSEPTSQLVMQTSPGLPSGNTAPPL